MTDKAAAAIGADQETGTHTMFALRIHDVGGDTVLILLEFGQTQSEMRAMPQLRQPLRMTASALNWATNSGAT